MSSLTRLADVRSRIAKAAAVADRSASDVSLIAVSKTFDIDQIRPVLEAGHRVFGENRVQEAQSKWPTLKATYPDAELHLIGSLQTNKADDAVALFDVIQTLDREKLAKALAGSMEKLGRRPACFVQVNTGEEPQKGGVLPADAPAFVQFAKEELNLPVVGLMAIPPAEEDPAPHFAFLARMTADLGLGRVSMGMSGDFETAIHLGATDIRVGSAIFGARA